MQAKPDKARNQGVCGEGVVSSAPECTKRIPEAVQDGAGAVMITIQKQYVKVYTCGLIERRNREAAVHRKKKHSAILASVLIAGVATVGWLESRNGQLFAWCSMEQINTHTLQSEQVAVPCGPMTADQLSWFGWLRGSSSTQFHYIDLLELLTPGKKA